MGNDFIFDDRESNGILKKVLISVAVVLGLGAILGFLIGNAVSNEAKNCQEVSAWTGIERCDKDEKFKRIVFVVGDTANTPKPDLNENDEKMIRYMYDQEGSKAKGLSYISVSEPDVVHPFDTKEKTARRITEDVIKQIESSYATANGADYLEAIKTAAQSIDDRYKEDSLIYVIGSGLSDSGILNFADGDLLTSKHSVDEIKKAVEAKVDDENILKGVTIFWEGFGITTAPQTALSRDAKDKEEKIYRIVLNKLGVVNLGNFIISKQTPDDVINEKATGVVKITKTEDECPIIDKVYGDNSEFGFKPDEPNLRDENAAKRELARLVGEYGKNAIFYIKPYMSRGVCDADKKDSLLNGRAERIKQLLMGAGVPESNIIVEEGEIGEANECPNGPGHYPVVGSEAVKNRKVKISVRSSICSQQKTTK